MKREAEAADRKREAAQQRRREAEVKPRTFRAKPVPNFGKGPPPTSRLSAADRKRCRRRPSRRPKEWRPAARRAHRGDGLEARAWRAQSEPGRAPDPREAQSRPESAGRARQVQAGRASFGIRGTASSGNSACTLEVHIGGGARRPVLVGRVDGVSRRRRRFVRLGLGELRAAITRRASPPGRRRASAPSPRGSAALATSRLYFAKPPRSTHTLESRQTNIGSSTPFSSRDNASTRAASCVTAKTPPS